MRLAVEPKPPREEDGAIAPVDPLVDGVTA